MGVLDTSVTFAATDTITSAKMNNIIDQTFFTDDAVDDSTIALSAGKLQVKAQGVTSNQLADNAATTSKVADGAITNAKVNASAAIALSKLATGTLPSAITVATANIIDANVTTAKIADSGVTAAKLSGAQTGTAPIYGARAWVNFDGKSNDDLSGSYTRSGSTTVIVNITAHGLIAGNRVYIDFTVGSGTAPFDGIYEVTAPITSDSFAVTSSVATGSTGTAVLKRKTIRAGGNISCVSAAGSSPVVPPSSNLSTQNGVYILNMAFAMPDSNFVISGAINENGAMASGDGNLAINGFAVNSSCAYLTVVNFGSAIDDCLHNSVIVVG
jgi:hypothetical protein